jgi:hypothetical protein
LPAPETIDRKLAASFRRRALFKAKGGEDFLLTHAANDMVERLLAVERTFEKAALIASPRWTRRMRRCRFCREALNSLFRS